jgi:hypothetical protein
MYEAKGAETWQENNVVGFKEFTIDAENRGHVSDMNTQRLRQ